MAHLWKRDADGAWAIVPLQAANYLLLENGALTSDRTSPPETAQAARLVRLPGPERAERWALVAPPEAQVAVNDWPLTLGLRVLRDRDQLRSGSRWCYYFSTEQLAMPEAFPDLGRPSTCPRCCRPLAPGERAVCCPQCSTWHHSTDEYPCWTECPTCSQCDQPTDPAASFRWTPAVL